MRKYLFRIILIVLFIALAVVELWPTFQDAQHQSALKSLSDKDSTEYFDSNEEAIRSARANRLKLGLDLQGGMYVTLEVDIVEMLEKLAKNEDETLRKILAETRDESVRSDETILDIFRRKFTERNMRLSRYYGDIRNTDDEVMKNLDDETEKAVERAVQIIRNRIDQYGVSEVAITRSGKRRIIMELPGVSDEREVRGLIQETAQLEFKLMADPNEVMMAFENINKVLLGKPIEEIVKSGTAGDTTALADGTVQDSTAKAAKTADAGKSTMDSMTEAGMTEEQKAEKFKKENPFTSLFIFNQRNQMYATSDQKERINNILAREDVRSAMPEGVQFTWAAKSESVTNDQGSQLYEFYTLKRDAELTGEHVTSAQAQIEQGGFGGAVVTMQMDAEGARDWARITGANVNKQVAIVLDNAVFSAPVVRQKIIGGNSQIDGMANMDEARLLEIVLKAGALPAPVEIIEERTVGPSLGEDSIRAGLNSFAIGVGFVLLFMLVYYKTAGVSADIAVIFNVIFILGILAGFHATLTLPGIAGILLTVGMAVDANVLINERVREEFDTGKTLRAAIDAGYSRAFPAIIDSNITTLITCIILYQFGSGPVQGFALTLMIGLICSMFTAIIMTRVIFEITLDNSPKLVKFG